MIDTKPVDQKCSSFFDNEQIHVKRFTQKWREPFHDLL